MAILEEALEESEGLPPITRINQIYQIQYESHPGITVEIPIQQVFEDQRPAPRGGGGGETIASVALKQFITNPNNPGELSSKNLEFIAKIVAYAFWKGHKRLPNGVIVEYLRVNKIQSVVLDRITDRSMAAVESDLRKILSDIQRGVLQPNSALSICKNCAFKTSCPHSLA